MRKPRQQKRQCCRRGTAICRTRQRRKGIQACQAAVKVGRGMAGEERGESAASTPRRRPKATGSRRTPRRECPYGTRTRKPARFIAANGTVINPQRRNATARRCRSRCHAPLAMANCRERNAIHRKIKISRHAAQQTWRICQCRCVV